MIVVESVWAPASIELAMRRCALGKGHSMLTSNYAKQANHRFGFAKTLQTQSKKQRLCFVWLDNKFTCLNENGRVGKCSRTYLNLIDILLHWHFQLQTVVKELQIEASKEKVSVHTMVSHVIFQ